MLGKRLFDELARQLGPRSSRRNSGPRAAKAPGTLSNPPNERTRALEPNVGTLLYLISLGVVAIATVAVFFGLGFFLLAHRVQAPGQEIPSCFPLTGWALGPVASRPWGPAAALSYLSEGRRVHHGSVDLQ
jgi:hypothetical protein